MSDLFADKITSMPEKADWPVRPMMVFEETRRMANMPGLVKAEMNIRSVVRPRKGHDV